MNLASILLKKRYLEPLKKQPTTYIGIELEYPIVNLSGQATDIKVSQKLMEVICLELAFNVEKRDVAGNPIQLKHQNGDCILFEVSYNTLEFAFAKARYIQEIEERFDCYLQVIQAFLRKENHELQGKGINPNWRQNDNRPISNPRYEMLTEFLSLSKHYPQMHSYPEYGAFICGNQVQLDVPKEKVYRILNAFNQIEGVKAYLFPNSPMPEQFPNRTITRDFFWEKSMHGLFKENIGIYSQIFQNDKDYLDYMSQSAMFSIERDGTYYYFAPLTVSEYFSKSELTVYGLGGKKVQIEPVETDIAFHRSYHYQELTNRGTVEFRSICTQAFEKTFAPIAFHLGLFSNFDYFESLLEQSKFLRETPPIRNHRMFYSQLPLATSIKTDVEIFAKQLLDCARIGLISRGYSEENYLDFKWLGH